MPLPVERLRAAALLQLTERERQFCVVYLSTEPIVRGETISLSRITFASPQDGYLTFIDLNPSANWGHACCYVCIDPETGKAHRVDAQFPPFGAAKAARHPRPWQVIYRAPGVPETLLAIPEN